MGIETRSQRRASQGGSWSQGPRETGDYGYSGRGSVLGGILSAETVTELTRAASTTTMEVRGDLTVGRIRETLVCRERSAVHHGRRRLHRDPLHHSQGAGEKGQHGLDPQHHPQVKFGTHPRIAEFFCMLTSPAYAAPCSLWLRAQASSYTWEIHVALTCCALTALWSTVYHARLSKVEIIY